MLLLAARQYCKIDSEVRLIFKLHLDKTLRVYIIPYGRNPQRAVHIKVIEFHECNKAKGN